MATKQQTLYVLEETIGFLKRANITLARSRIYSPRHHIRRVIEEVIEALEDDMEQLGITQLGDE